MKPSIVTDPSLAPSGVQKIEWVAKNMPILNNIKERFEKEQPFAGLKIAISIHLEAKTAYFAKVLRAGGATVAVTGCNPLSTQDDVAAGLALDDGIYVYGKYGTDMQEYEELLNAALDIEPDIFVDDGGDLTHLLHTTRTPLAEKIRGGSEETTTGVMRLRARQAETGLRFPMIAANDAFCKYLFDNRYGTGQSVWDGMTNTTNLIVAGKNVVIVGYGWCGKGCAMRAKGLGANVIVCEVDTIKAIEAVMDGFRVMTMDEAAKIGDFFVTVTGCKRVIFDRHFDVMKDGAILANAGHFDVEIAKDELLAKATQVKCVRKNIDGYKMADGRWINLIAEGRLVNLASGNGHPAEIMDMSFGIQALSVEYIAKNYKTMDKKVYEVPEHLDAAVAALKLQGLGITIDQLTEEQKEYIKSSGE